jgi:hypothetical protein
MTVDDEMAGHARAAAKMVLAEYGYKLDFSEPTIGAVEALLDGFSREGDDRELFARVALLFGSYIGEIIRGYDPGASWVTGSLSPDAPPPFLRAGTIEVSPIVWCFKRLHHGASAGVVDKYMAFRQAASERDRDA